MSYFPPNGPGSGGNPYNPNGPGSGNGNNAYNPNGPGNSNTVHNPRGLGNANGANQGYQLQQPYQRHFQQASARQFPQGNYQPPSHPLHQNLYYNNSVVPNRVPQNQINPYQYPNTLFPGRLAPHQQLPQSHTLQHQLVSQHLSSHPLHQAASSHTLQHQQLPQTQKVTSHQQLPPHQIPVSQLHPSPSNPAVPQQLPQTQPAQLPSRQQSSLYQQYNIPQVPQGKPNSLQPQRLFPPLSTLDQSQNLSDSAEGLAIGNSSALGATPLSQNTEKLQELQQYISPPLHQPQTVEPDYYPPSGNGENTGLDTSTQSYNTIEYYPVGAESGYNQSQAYLDCQIPEDSENKDYPESSDYWPAENSQAAAAEPSEIFETDYSSYFQGTSRHTPETMPAVNEDHGIRDVWVSNMEEEMMNISRVVQTHRYIALDTEFPGVVARPIGEFRSTQEYTYHQMRCNVNLLKIIQIGFTFFDEHGNRAKPISTWQFNFKFCLGDDMYAQESIDLLRKSGIQFEKHERDGMDPFDFASELIGAGVVLQQNTFLSFHSGYDFGYLIKMLINTDLEEEDENFFSKLKYYCPDIYDVKYLMKSCKDLKGGLQEVSDYLQIKRVGPQHQAGSDSLLTGMAFFKMRELYFENNIEKEKYSGHLYGLGPFASSSNPNNITNGVGGSSYADFESTDNGTITS